ncbi:MAG: hypothetical protein V1749_11010 [Candidatus Desantisbacteria bacterium]
MSITNKFPSYRIFFGILPTIIACLILAFLMSSRKEATVELRLLFHEINLPQQDGNILLKNIPAEIIRITDFKETVIKPQSLYWKKITPAGNIKKQEISWGIGMQLVPVGDDSSIEIAGDKIVIAELQQGNKTRVSFKIKGNNNIDIGLDGGCDSRIKLNATDLVKLKIKGCSLSRENESPEKGMPESFWMIPSGMPLEFSPKKDSLRIQMRLLPETKGFPIIQGRFPLKDFRFDREINGIIRIGASPTPTKAGTSTTAMEEGTLFVNGKKIQTGYAWLDTNKLQVKEIRLDDNKECFIVTMVGKTKSIKIGKTQNNLAECLPSCLDDVYQNSSWMLIFIVLAWLFGTAMAFLG